MGSWGVGKYQPGVDRPDPKTWKANFRCAMNSLPDIEEVKDKSIKKGTNAFRVYKMLSSTERSLKKGENCRGEHVLHTSCKYVSERCLCSGKKKAEKEGKSKENKEVGEKRQKGGGGVCWGVMMEKGTATTQLLVV